MGDSSPAPSTISTTERILSSPVRRDIQVWGPADFPERTKAPHRPPVELESEVRALSGRKREVKILEALGLQEIHRNHWRPLDKNNPEDVASVDPILFFSDFRYVCESFFRIPSKYKSVVPFLLNPVQLSFIFHRTGRDAINKARQHGFTTLMLAYYLWDAITNPHTVCFILTHLKKATRALIKRVRDLWACLPDAYRPALVIDQAELLTFANGSSFNVAVVGDAAGRSFMCNNLLCSEVAHWKVDDETMVSIMNSVPKGSSGSITLETTPKGIGNYFHRECLKAMNPEQTSAFKYFEFPWWLNPDYDEEWATIAQAECGIETEKGKRAWYQEFCCSFEQSHRAYFQAEDCRPRSPLLKRIVQGPVGVDDQDRPVIGNYPNYLWVFQEPDPDDRYVIGVDIAKGLEHGDYTSMTVLSRRHRIEVAHVYGHMPPEKAAMIVDWLGRRYNNALVGVEAMQDGLTVLSNLVNIHEYRNLFHHIDPLRPQLAPPLGWQTNRRTREPMLSDFEKDVRERNTLLAFPYREEEMRAFTRDEKGKPCAPKGLNDDTIISGGIANALLAYDDMMVDDEFPMEVSGG